MRVLLLALAALVLGLASLGCTPNIGDRCTLSTDCSVQGNVLCDTSQPNGYCTTLNCHGNDCLNMTYCVMFNAAVAGCPYNDRNAPSRTARSMCLAPCSSNSDCRTDDGFICASPLGPPWNALILDNDQTEHVCIVAPDNVSHADASGGVSVDAAVCQPTGPALPALDASMTYFGPDASDAGADVAGADGGEDAPPDGPLDGSADAGAPDAPDAGG